MFISYKLDNKGAPWLLSDVCGLCRHDADLPLTSGSRGLDLDSTLAQLVPDGTSDRMQVPRGRHNPAGPTADCYR